MTRAPRWTPDDDQALLTMRDVELKGWGAIAEALPERTVDAIKLRYYSALKSRNAVATDRRRKAGRPRTVAPPAPAVVLEPIASPPLAVLPSPAPVLPIAPAEASGGRRVSTATLQAEAELLARIALQGVTAGLMGDPLPGRSALDQRRAGRPGGGNG